VAVRIGRVPLFFLQKILRHHLVPQVRIYLVIDRAARQRQQIFGNILGRDGKIPLKRSARPGLRLDTDARSPLREKTCAATLFGCLRLPLTGTICVAPRVGQCFTSPPFFLSREQR
jgi:hypothetical protein